MSALTTSDLGRALALAAMAVGLVAAPRPAGAVPVTTAPAGDYDGDGLVNSVDLQCAVLTFEAVTAAEQSGAGATCATDGECAAGSYCREAFTEERHCLPLCLANGVALGEAQAAPCTDPAAATESCLGLTAKPNGDLDCDGALTNTDLDFVVAIIVEALGGEGTPDHDGDGRLNFCDDDTDQDGHADDQDCQVLLEGPDPGRCGSAAPDAPQITLGPARPGVDDDLVVTITAAATDPDGDPVTYLHTWTRDGAPVGGLDRTAPHLAASHTAAGETWRVEVRATDGAHIGPAAAAQVVVGDEPPTVTGVTITPAPFSVLDQPVCDATVSDIDDPNVELTVKWLVDGAVVDPLGELGVPWSRAANNVVRADAVTCEVTASDGIGDPVVATSAAVAVANAPPTMTPPEGQDAFTTVPRAEAGRDEDIDCNQDWNSDLVYADPDGDPAWVTVTWLHRPSGASEFVEVESLLVGDPVLGRAGGPTPADAFVFNPSEVGAGPGDQFKCRLLISDNWATTCQPDDCPADVRSGEVVVETSPPVTVENNAPTLATVQIAPAAPRAGDVVACAATGAADEEGDDVTVAFEFFINDASAQGPGPDDDIQGGFGRGDTIRCEATPSDPFTSGTTLVSETITVVNTPPAAVAATVAPAAPSRGDELTCQFTQPASPDVDGDTVTASVAWLSEVDGVLVASGHVGTTLPAAATTACERWACRVDSDDGVDEVSETSPAVEITGDTALTFNGTSSVVSVASSAVGEALTRIDGVSVSLWFRGSASASDRVLFSKPNRDAVSYPDADELRLEVLGSGHVSVTFRPFDRDDPTYTKAAVTLQSSTTVEANTWHHVLFVADAAAGTATLYLDGAQAASGAATPPDDPTGDLYSLAATDLYVGRRCVGTCAGGAGDRAFGGDIDEIHVAADALTPASVPFTPADEATAGSSTILLFGFNEAANDSAPARVVDRGGAARHGTPTDVTWSGSSRKGGCTPEPTFAPVPAQLVASPASEAAYPGASFTCAADVVEVSADPEGEAVSDTIRWALDGTVDPSFDGASSLSDGDVADCVDVRCDLVTTDTSGASATRSRAFVARSAAAAGAASPPHDGVTSFGSQADHEAALAPLILTPADAGWTVSFWIRFAATPSKDTAVTIGDQPGGSPAELSSYVDIDIQRRASAAPVSGDDYAHDCGVHLTAFTWFAGEYVQTADHFAVIERVLGDQFLADPCSSASWHHIAVQRHGATFTVLGAELVAGATAPGAMAVLGTFTDSDANDTALMLARMHDPTVALTRFGSAVHLDDLHILDGLRYAATGGDIPRVGDTAQASTRLLWTMEPIEGIPGFLTDLGPWSLAASVTNGGAAPTGLGDGCAAP